MRQKKRGARRKVAGSSAAHNEQASMTSANSDTEHHGNWMEALNTIFPTIANAELHSPEELITAIARLLRLKDITMEVLRDTSIGAYIRDLCDHPSVQVRSAAYIALDCFQTVLFEWADSTNWSKEEIMKACLEADREIRHKACKSASLATSDSTKKPIVIRDDKNISTSNTSNINANIGNDHYMHFSTPNLTNLSSSNSYEEDSLYTPTEPSLRLRERMHPPQTAKKRTRLHVHFPSPPIPSDN